VCACEICNRAIIGSEVIDAETALKRALDATIGRKATSTETAVIASLESLLNG
jgi:hypothetical protein